MKIGLIDVDKQSRHQNTFPNLALCKIASYYRQQGDGVEWAHQMEYYDIIYMAKVFNFTPPIRISITPRQLSKAAQVMIFTLRSPTILTIASLTYQSIPI